MLVLKAVHIAGLLVWCAGLLYLPGLLLAHRSAWDPQSFGRVRMAVRMGYMGLASPAAFLAVGAGSALVFVADALHPWMFVKLMAVGVLVIAHIQVGHLIAHLADPDHAPPHRRIIVIWCLVGGAILSILWLVLAKPEFSIERLPVWMREPGLLDPPRPLPRS
ncbi:CopD family protein [Iodidimonas sp. SYSU 1G8]|uniref:CopD family protein n=1 Tax=Iodidimonas sp. SYSU 1G8 TaxID=3133967 RepID=UPI0031FE8122